MEGGSGNAIDYEDEEQTPAAPEDDYAADSMAGTGSSPTANIIASAGLSLLPDKNLSFLSDELNKRQRCNAKAVEWLSTENEHLGQFRSVRLQNYKPYIENSILYSKLCRNVSTEFTPNH